MVLAITGFLLLRRDRPDWPRPYRLSNRWIGVAVALAVYNTIIVVGVLNPGTAAYGGLDIR